MRKTIIMSMALLVMAAATQVAIAENCSRYADPYAIGACLERKSYQDRRKQRSYENSYYAPYKSPGRQSRMCNAQSIAGFGYNKPMERAWCR